MQFYHKHPFLPQPYPSHSLSTSTTPPSFPPLMDNPIQSPTQPKSPSEPPSKIPIRPQKIRKLESVTPQPLPKPKRRTINNLKTQPNLPIKPLTTSNQLQLAIQHLRHVDPLLIPLIDSNPLPHFERHHRPFLALTKSILYQQLAYKAGTSIYNRFIALCGGEDCVRPDNVLALSLQQLKQIGVSGRKATYLCDLASKYKSGILSDEKIVGMDDRSLFTMLSMVKGIGAWSVHMFMIFSLHRPDVLPVSDLGVRKGVRLLYGLDELPRPSVMEVLCEKWRPFRSVGAWYMWRFVEGKEGPTAGVGLDLGGGFGQPLEIGEREGQFVEPVNNGACIWNQ